MVMAVGVEETRLWRKVVALKFGEEIFLRGGGCGGIGLPS